MTSIVNKIIKGESNGDSFGHAVSLSSDGSIVAISAPNNEGDLTSATSPLGTITNDTNIYYQTAGNVTWSKANPTASDYLPAHLKKGINPGGVKIFQNNGSEWVQLGSEIKGNQLWDQKGISLSLSGDGKTLVVGNALSLNSSFATHSNFSIYKLNDGIWSQIGTDIKGSDTNETINYEVVVAEKTSSHDSYGSGSDYGFKIDNKFTHDLSLTSGNTYKFNQSDSTNTNHPLFFYLDENKTTPYTDNVSIIGNPGTAGAYTQIKVTENTPATLYYQCTNHSLMGDSLSTNSNIYSDYFGYSTSLSSNGNVLAVGGFYGNLAGKTNTGYVKIYENNGQEFERIGDLLLGDSINSSEFGFSLDLSADGSIVAVSSAEGGNVFIYKRSGDNWIKQGNTISFIDYESNQKLDSLLKEEFVIQVKITEDGKYIAVGSPNSDDNGLNSGILKVYKESDSSWVQVGEDIKGKNLDHLGTYIDIEEDSNGFLTLAASGTKENGESYVNIYKLFGTDWISFASFDSTDNQGFPTSSLDISNNGRYLVTGTSHSPVNNTNYDDNFLSAGYIGFNEETGNARVYDLNAGIIGTKNEDYSADSKGFSSTSGSAPVAVTSYEIGQETTLDSIKDYDGNLHAGDTLDATASSYKYQGMLDVNGDGVFETIFTNKSSRRWVTAEVHSAFSHIDFSDHGKGGTTRVVGIYIDPLVTIGIVEQGSDHDSQRRFQNDLKIDNLIAKHSGDYDSDGIHEVYWKTNDGTAYLRALMHADGNIRYANYQSKEQMSEYLTANGDESVISDIV